MIKFTIDTANAFAAEIRARGLGAAVTTIDTCDYDEAAGKYGPKYTLVRVQVTASDPTCPSATQIVQVLDADDAAKLAAKLVADLKRVIKAKSGRSARLAAKWGH